MFRYIIALDVSFSGQTPTITQDDAADKPLHGRVAITVGPQISISGPGGTMVLPTGSQITGTIIGKEELP